jgi:hypothetical protein
LARGFEYACADLGQQIAKRYQTLATCRLGISSALDSYQVVWQSHVDGVPQREPKHLIACRSIRDARANGTVLSCEGGNEAETGDRDEDRAKKARRIGKQNSDGVGHYLLLLSRGLLRVKLFVDTELDRLVRLTRPANICDRGCYEDCADHASLNLEDRH